MSDARYYNGGPDEGPRFEPDGPRREAPAASDYFGRPCDRCGRTCHRVYTLADVGVFCSVGCRSKATVPAQKQGAA